MAHSVFVVFIEGDVSLRSLEEVLFLIVLVIFMVRSDVLDGCKLKRRVFIWAVHDSWYNRESYGHCL